jgi:hypothetical protein
MEGLIAVRELGFWPVRASQGDLVIDLRQALLVAAVGERDEPSIDARLDVGGAPEKQILLGHRQQRAGLYIDVLLDAPELATFSVIGITIRRRGRTIIETADLLVAAVAGRTASDDDEHESGVSELWPVACVHAAPS